MTALTFVYDADGSLIGEARYWFGTLFGAEHCSLCDLTHSRWGKRRDFTDCAERIGIPIEYLHRDRVPVDIRAVASGWPCVIGHDGDAVREVLGPDDLAACDADLTRFEEALRLTLLR